ncbi:MAG: hypothetical protein AAGJ81_16230 [Verrucomicrobiota bacterium]
MSGDLEMRPIGLLKREMIEKIILEKAQSEEWELRPELYRLAADLASCPERRSKLDQTAWCIAAAGQMQRELFQETDR